MILRYLARRLFLLGFVFVALTIFVFSLNYLFPGDLVSNLTGLRDITPEQHQQLQHTLGLDQSLWQQYIEYNRRLLAGDWGLSFASQQSVLHEIGRVLPATLRPWRWWRRQRRSANRLRGVHAPLWPLRPVEPAPAPGRSRRWMRWPMRCLVRPPVLRRCGGGCRVRCGLAGWPGRAGLRARGSGRRPRWPGCCRPRPKEGQRVWWEREAGAWGTCQRWPKKQKAARIAGRL